jgi:hypothetical protein
MISGQYIPTIQSLPCTKYVKYDDRKPETCPPVCLKGHTLYRVLRKPLGCFLQKVSSVMEK